MNDIEKTLKDIAKRYTTEPLHYDELSESFVKSICDYYEKNDRISEKQLLALTKISNRIKANGERKLPEVKAEPEHPGYLGLNCRTGEVNWYSWQEFDNGN